MMGRVFFFFLFGCASSTNTEPAPEKITEDADGDGFSSEEDCDDSNSLVSPEAEEVCDGADNNCDGQIDEDVQSNFYADSDLDGFGNPDLMASGCEAPSGFVSNGSDCDDTDEKSYPSAEEVCDDADNNCDGNIDEELGQVYYADSDGDGFGDENTQIQACQIQEGLSTIAEDCDDNNEFINPLAQEECDEVDNNCDGAIDEGLLIDFFADIDEDGFGDTTDTVATCAAPEGYVEQAGDCDDLESFANPAMTEVCDGIDNDCDGSVDGPDSLDAQSFYTDADGDGFGAIEAPQYACVIPVFASPLSNDCNDNEATMNPATSEICDGLDNNCDGSVDEAGAAGEMTLYIDADGDGFGDDSTVIVRCTQGSGEVLQGGDCNDQEALANPAMVEICDGLDNNCDEIIDEDSAIDVSSWYVDFDGDGFGDPNSSVQRSCEAPQGTIDNDNDCDDNNALVNPAVQEVCDGIDNDCDASTIEELGEGEDCAAESCLDLLEYNPTLGSDSYWIDPDGNGAIYTTCDMSSDGGGWTLMLHLNDSSGFEEDDFLTMFGNPNFTDHSWNYDGSLHEGIVRLISGVDQGAIAIDRFSGLWTDVRMACNASNLATTEGHFAQVDGYTTSNGNDALLGSTSNGTSYAVLPSSNSFGLSTIWHDNEETTTNSGHYHCDYTNAGPNGTAQFGFCYTDFLNNNNSLDYGDSIVSLAFGTSLGNDSWSTGFSGECGDMGTGYLNNTGTFWIWIR